MAPTNEHEIDSPRDDMVTLGRQILDLFPRARASLDFGNTGGAMLSVVLRDHLIVMEYAVNQGFGVDEVLPGEGFVPGYRNVYDEFSAAKVALLEILRQVEYS
jgi:hypothetical protein